MEVVAGFLKTLFGYVVQFLVEILLEPVLRLVRRIILKLFPKSRLARFILSSETKVLRYVRVTWIHEAQALRIVNTFDFIDDQIRELVNPLDIYIDSNRGLKMVPNEARIEREFSDYGESVPEHQLGTFVEQNPLSKKAGMYNKHALVFWLQESQRAWDRMLEEK